MYKGEKFLEKKGIEDILMDFDKEGELICCSHLIDKALNEQLTIHSVSQQRELLERLNKIENWCYNKATDEDLGFLNKIFRSENCG